MKKLPIEYYASKDEEIVYALEMKYGLFVAVYNVKVGKWIYTPKLNSSILNHEDDIYPYGENGALMLTKDVYPDKVLQEPITEFEKVWSNVEKEIKEGEEFFKDYDESNKR